MRTDGRPPRIQSDWSATAILLMVLIVGLTLFGAFARSIPIMYGGALLGGCLLPRVTLPVAALWLLVLVPIGYMDTPRFLGQYLTPAVLVTGIWMARIIIGQPKSLLPGARIRGWLIVGSFFALFLASALNSGRLDLTVAWGGAVIVCIIAPAMLGQVAVDDVWPGVRRALAAIAVFLGMLAAADAYLQFNPWTSLYRGAFQAYEWSVFRTKTSLGHPLTTSTIASVALSVCLFPHGARRRWPYLICAVGAGAAVILSVSRTSIFAVGLATIVGVFAVRQNGISSDGGQARGRFVTLMIAAVLAGAIAWSPLLSERNQASEATLSAANRSNSFDNTLDMFSAHPLLGVGPGTSPDAYFFSYNEVLENSAFQLLLSVGLPAFLIAIAGLAAVVGVALRRGRPGVAGGIVAFLISSTGFNVLDVAPALLAVISPLIFCSVAPVRIGGQPTTEAADASFVSSRNVKPARPGAGARSPVF